MLYENNKNRLQRPIFSTAFINILIFIKHSEAINMKTLTILAALVLTLSAFAFSQTNPDRITVPLDDPSRPAFLKVSLISGSITVKGYSGKDVIVDALRGDSDDEENDNNSDDDDKKVEKKRGLNHIPNISTGVTAEEDDNEVTVGTGGMASGRTLNLTIQVPTNCSMKLSTINDGDVKVDNVTGDIEVSDLNGAVAMTGISGSAVVDALNGEINVVFSEVDEKKSMSFSSMNGDIDVTFPSDIKATMQLKNDMGEIYSDFDIKMDYSTPKIEDNAKEKHGKHKVSMEKMMTGAINGGGGSDILFKNFNGDIFIRKGK